MRKSVKHFLTATLRSSLFTDRFATAQFSFIRFGEFYSFAEPIVHSTGVLQVNFLGELSRFSLICSKRSSRQFNETCNFSSIGFNFNFFLAPFHSSTHNENAGFHLSLNIIASTKTAKATKRNTIRRTYLQTFMLLKNSFSTH